MSLELADIQGNVLAGYNLPHAAYLFAAIDDGGAAGAAARALLAELHPLLTSAAPWTSKPASTLNIALSARGLAALGVPAQVLETFPEEFRDGMAERAETMLRDTGPSRREAWEDAFRDARAHLLLMVNAASPEALEQRAGELRARVESAEGVHVVAEQRAGTLAGAREHFGFADGFDQPAVAGARGGRPGEGVRTKDGWRPVAAGEFVLGYDDEDGGLPAAPAAPLGRNGTYLVYRKLEQDIARFREIVRDHAERFWDGDTELVAAKLVGRWRDGSPLVLSPRRTDPVLAADRDRVNDFRYAADPRGFACPLGAHIRRTNPRDGLPGGAERTRRHRIIRRGMSYGAPLPEDAPADGTERGLIFMCFNASIARQFEVLQGWCMDGDQFGLGDDRDFLTGSNEENGGKMTIQGTPPRFVSPQPPLVITRGGEYLFLPGLTALRALARD